MFTTFNVFLMMLGTVSVFAILGVLYSRGKVDGMDQFLTARGTAGKKMLSATLLASFLGVFMLFTPPEAGILGGIPAVVGYSIGVVSLYIAFMVLSPKVKEYMPTGSTLTDYVLKRYGHRMYLLTIVVALFYMLVHLVAELTAIGQVAFELAEVPMLYTALLVGLATVIYTAYGGLRASIFTDMVQMVFVIILLIGVTVGVVYYGGGINNIHSQITTYSPQLLSFNNWGGIQYGLTLCIAVFVSNLFHQGYWQRIYAGKDNKTLSKSLMTSTIIVFPIMILTGVLGIVAAGFNQGNNPSVALFSLAYSIFPAGLIVALFLLALVLVMSTVDTLMNSIIATLAKDSKRLFKNTKEEKLLRIARIATVIMILPVALVSARGYSVLYLFFVADLVCAGVCFPLFFGLYSKKCTENMALISSVLGIISGIPFFIANQLLLSFTVPIIVSASICLLATRLSKSELIKGIEV
ncbi:hypothetical protein HYG86_07895 [Alkalicella caledoniensis]|uniref:Sodium:solute symporter family protein n=1 Tax=Alkalicella caledoniensis TaxID=2731377 RepID=A0A7G9W7Q3_ALKCA|nr:hypothetical protein [Alkalicella caledoniensis]QNO14715.1 hypothetical protein HYG86_07895 [Alkalicella caledoniensis]